MENTFNSKDYTIVTACRNREKNLKIAIKSWFNVNPFQIIIIDWGSDIPLKLEHFDSEIRPLLKIIRFEHPRWVLSWAYNEGLSKVETKFTCKLDCDHVIEKNFLLENKCFKFGMARGSHRYAEKGQQFINGAFICCSEILKEIGFFDERITTYGWDDSDLFYRASDYCKFVKLINNKTISHLPQTNEERTTNQSVKKEEILARDLKMQVDAFCIHRNRFLQRLFAWDWGKDLFVYREYNRKKFEEEIELLLSIASMQTFYEFKKFVFKKKDIINYYYELLYKYFPEEYIPINLLFPDLLERYHTSLLQNDAVSKNIIKYNLLSISINKDSLDNRLLKIEDIVNNNNSTNNKLGKNVKNLIIRPMHGLGNRMRVIASAYNIAKNSGRNLIICWDKDEHINADFYELFKKQNFEINVKFTNSSFLKDIHEISFYQYLENDFYSHKDKEIDTDTELDILIFSSCVLKSKLTNYLEENKFLQSLQISKEVEEISRSVNISRKHIGVHIRYDGEGWESLPSEQVSNWNSDAHKILKKNRNESKPHNFVERMEFLLEKDKDARFFIAVADKKSLDYIDQKFPNKIDNLSIPDNLKHRDLLSQKYALADMLLLSKCKHLLGSGWSSFTEVANRLAFKTQIMEIKGRDF